MGTISFYQVLNVNESASSVEITKLSAKRFDILSVVKIKYFIINNYLNFISMKQKNLLSVIACLLISFCIQAQQVKNVIFMIPDGTSISDLALARWFQFYKDSTKTQLALDPYLCGLVKTHSSNAPIGDSAPTMGAYMTGYRSQTGFVGMYPPKHANDLVYVNPMCAYSPRLTVMEAARIVQNKAIGLVFTCEFPHATPANTSSHWYNRGDYKTIQEQMVHNSIDVLIGGGAGLLTKEQEEYLKASGCQVMKNDIQNFRNSEKLKFWALFGEKHMANDWDRDPTKQPSLAEMTKKAINTLSKNQNGFFLMVEGSKIDWSSHRNDPVGILSETLAFDAAVKETIEFAKADGNTVVVVCPDHGNGGISIGNSRSDSDYDKLSLQAIMEPLKKCEKTSEYITEYLTHLPQDSILPVIQREWNIPNISQDTIKIINELKEIYLNDIQNSKKKDKFNDIIAKVLQSRTYIGFTTCGHTGEDVFLAIYHPNNHRLNGLINAPEITRYLCNAVGYNGSLDDLTDEYYCKSIDLFNEKDFTIIDSPLNLKVTPRNNKKQTLIIETNSNQVKLNEQIFHTKTPAIHVDKNNTWYVSKECLSILISNK
jgi:alkaline phosphatase